VEDKLREAALAVSSAEGEKMFEDLALSLAGILEVEFVTVATHVMPGRTHLRSLARVANGRVIANAEYPIAGTPCERAMGRDFGYFPEKVRSLFGRDSDLEKFAIESYAASTLNDSRGEPIGLLSVMSRRPLSNAALVEAMLKIFAARVSAELVHRAGLEKLRVSEAQYRAMFDAAADGLVLRDADFRIVDVNLAYERMSGNSRAEVIGQTRLTFQVPEANAEVMALHRRALAGEQILFEAPAQRRDGRRVQLELRGVPMQHQGRPHVLYVGRDVTERKANEARLRASEEQYRAMFDAAADSLVLRDADFRIVDVNLAYEAMSGRPRAEAIGRQDVTMSDPALAERIRTMHRRALAGEQVAWEAAARRKGGEAFTIEVRGVPIRHQGRPHVLYVGRDISDRKRAETERAQLEAQLRQAQKMEAIGHLTGGIAHDFNNILQGILGNLALAEERQAELSDARLARYLDRARHSAQRARELIAQMLTFSRGQRGARRPVALAELVRDACKLLRSTLPATIDLRQSLAEDLPPLTLDPVQVEQVVLNLCINARDAMRGAGAIRIGVRPPARIQAVCSSCRQKVDGRYIELVVRDTGPGIPAQVMDRMFEPFFSTKEVGRGSGMGLSLAHGIVHEHGGHIVVDSIVNERTKFRVLFEAPALEAVETAPQADPTQPPVRSRPRLKGRVMVVDDEETIREFMVDLLGGWGLAVTAHPDGAAALAAFAAAPADYDVIITDHSMPQLTGLALAREMSRLRPGLPVILYTGYGEALSPAELAEAGVAQLVRKPIEPAQFFPLLAQHFNNDALLPARNKSAAA
jgi:PAS domain S-box-containing protein